MPEDLTDLTAERWMKCLLCNKWANNGAEDHGRTGGTELHKKRIWRIDDKEYKDLCCIFQITRRISLLVPPGHLSPGSQTPAARRKHREAGTEADREFREEAKTFSGLRFFISGL